jgi:arylsulfatase
VRWPGKIPAGRISNEIVSHEDWLPTLLAAAGVPDVKDRLLQGYQAGSMTYRVHLDGYNQIDHLMAKAPSARKKFFYFRDDGSLVAPEI